MKITKLFTAIQLSDNLEQWQELGRDPPFPQGKKKEGDPQTHFRVVHVSRGATNVTCWMIFKSISKSERDTWWCPLSPTGGSLHQLCPALKKKRKEKKRTPPNNAERWRAHASQAYVRLSVTRLFHRIAK